MQAVIIDNNRLLPCLQRVRLPRDPACNEKKCILSRKFLPLTSELKSSITISVNFSLASFYSSLWEAYWNNFSGFRWDHLIIFTMLDGGKMRGDRKYCVLLKLELAPGLKWVQIFLLSGYCPFLTINKNNFEISKKKKTHKKENRHIQAFLLSLWQQWNVTPWFRMSHHRRPSPNLIQCKETFIQVKISLIFLKWPHVSKGWGDLVFKAWKQSYCCTKSVSTTATNWISWTKKG